MTIKNGGGDMRYRYTKSPERIEWTDAVYEHGALLATIIPKIEWSSYSYIGEVELINNDEITIINLRD